MTDQELTIWEHLDSVMRVITSKEMGAWLYRRDKRVLEGELEKIKEEIENLYKFEVTDTSKLYLIIGNEVCNIIDKHISELKGE